MLFNTGVQPSSTAELRKSNRHNVFMEIFNKQSISKEQIKSNLGLSLPTVTQNLHELEESGIIKKNGLFCSTGGRKANAYSVISNFRIAVGFYIQKASYSIEAINLYGETLATECFDHPFENDLKYYQQLGNDLNGFIVRNSLNPASILGVNIALEAIVSPDHTTVTYSEVYKCTGVTLNEIGINIFYPCKLYHDSHATAEAELWARKDIKNAVIVMLNRYMGGSLIIDSKICGGNAFECVMEHMRLSTNGPKCYCGKTGCFETFCSAYALERDVGESLNSFFEYLRRGDKKRVVLWEQYLRNLAIAINNVRMLIDCEFIIGGYLLRFLTDKDFIQLKALVNDECPIGLGDAIISPSCCKSESAAQGAALPLIIEYLHTI